MDGNLYREASVRTRSTRWVFTLNNYTDDDVNHLVTVLEPVTKYLVFGREVGDSGTPHLQGFFQLTNSGRFNAVKQLVGARAWIAQARGTTQQASDYCKKEDDYEEFGDCPHEQGHRSDWDDYRDFVRALGRVPSTREVINHNISLWARYGKSCGEIAEALLDPVSLTNNQPRFGWQTTVCGRIDGSVTSGANPRSIDFVVDVNGAAGKSWICRWAMTKHPDLVQVLKIGRRDDLAHAIDETKTIFLFDVPRTQMEFLQYSVLEMLKDQMVFSPKYSSRMKTLRAVPYVAVFSNEAPDESKLSPDRFNIINV